MACERLEAMPSTVETGMLSCSCMEAAGIYSQYAIVLSSGGIYVALLTLL